MVTLGKTNLKAYRPYFKAEYDNLIKITRIFSMFVDRFVKNMLLLSYVQFRKPCARLVIQPISFCKNIWMTYLFLFLMNLIVWLLVQ